METIIRDKLVTFLEEKNIMINNSQHGLYNKHFCLTNLLEFHNDVFNIYNETKAFDIESHTRLLKKVESHGITGKTLN